ncbi:hypothetical protein EJ02DRAFT_427253 [Clathrospora elynae]|uniref:Uncharacterized protein n=1 Tax=Clathrospora elynae TaxID=706981 RepID=A0A6A5SAZ9_9PLEO|nr:hypothetical protein EJ02DRAFT_427253 [Clathrospora elynae]
MPRMVALPPSGEFQIVLSKPFTDDVHELMTPISALRGFPSHETKDIYGLDTKVDFNTMGIQWSNQDDDAAKAGGEAAGEQKDEFKRIVDSIEALARQFAKQDSAV